MKPITRKELYLNKIVGNNEFETPEKPITTEEFFFSEILGEAVQAPEPLTRYQMYLAKIAGREIEIPYPKVRLEYFLAKACGMDIETPTPITREEIFWSNYSAIVDFEVEGVPPLTYKAIEGTLENYRIYGDTVDGESVGDRTGNLFDGEIEQGGFNSDGINLKEEPVNPRRIRSKQYISVIPNTVYSFSVSTALNIDLSVSFYDKSDYTTKRIGYVNWSHGNTLTFRAPTNCTYIRVLLKTESDSFITPSDISNIMLNVGSTALPYEPYGYKVPVTVEGKNLFSSRIEQGSFDGMTGAPSNLSTRVRSHEDDYIFLAPGVYKISAMGVEHLVVYAYDLPDVNAFNYNLSRTNWAPLPSTITINTSAYYKFAFCKTNNPIITPSDISNIMLNAGSDALPYEPYHTPVTTPIYLPEPIKMVGDEAEYIDYGEQKQYIKTTDGQEKYVVGLNVDFENKTFTRLADAIGLSKGTDFDIFSAFGGRCRCNVADNGTITAYYGDANYTEDGSNGQVMVYQPAFYYKVEPLKTEAQESGVGYHLRNVNYYISNHQGSGFKLHPAFYNEAGDRVDYILLGAYEGCIYDTSANAYITDDSQVMNSSEDKFSSIANVKPASGQTQNLTRPNLETICKNRGNGWHSLNIRIASMEQLLMIIELGTMNTQTGAGSNGIISITGKSSYNCASLTGSTASLGNASGQAESTISDIGGAQTVETANGKTAYSFRGDENPWGNIWKFVYGVNIWGDGTMNGGVPYICTDFDFSESKNTDNYESAGFSVPNANGYVNALGYSENFDWLMMSSEIGGIASLPVGDYNYVTANLNGYKIARLGGSWDGGLYAGGVEWSLKDDVGYRGLSMGGRLVYIPQIEKQHIYTTGIEVSLPALPTLPGTNVLSVGTEVQPSKVYVKYKGERK